MDKDWYLAVNGFARHTPWLHGFIPPYALWGGLLALSVLLVIIWCWSRRQQRNTQLVAMAFLTGISAVVALVLNQQLISPSIARTRPCSAIADVHALLPCTSDYSMPSDHCMIAGAFAAGIWLLNRAAGSLAIALALLLAFGRVYSGVHYPVDTIVGLLGGAGIALVIVFTLRAPLTRFLTWLPDPLRTLIAGPSVKAMP